MKILVDMNLSPDWVPAIRSAGIEAVHWSTVGDPKAPDHDVIAWAVANEALLLTHDLDFGAILAASGDLKPSVLQLRSQDLSPGAVAVTIVGLVRRLSDELKQGALVSFDAESARVRLLPLKPRSD